MAYRPRVNLRERSGAIAAVIAVHVALLLALLNLSGKIDIGGAQSALRVIDIRQLLPPPPKPRVQKQSPAKARQGGTAPNIKSQATPVVAPKPRIQPPPQQQIATTETPRQGAAPTQGAAPVAGPGTGTGGAGSGSGSGMGSGSGADTAVAEPPRLVTPVLSGRVFSPDQLRDWPRGATVFLRLRVDANGYVAECLVDRGTGVAAIDGPICNLAHERLRFRPALNRSGQAVAGWFGYAQPPPR